MLGRKGVFWTCTGRLPPTAIKFSICMPASLAGDLDDAVLDRMDEALEFGLPDAQERKVMLELYLDRYIVKAGTEEGGAGAGALTPGGRVRSALKFGRSSVDQIEVRGVDESLLWDTARVMEGFSGERAQAIALLLYRRNQVCPKYSDTSAAIHVHL